MSLLAPQACCQAFSAKLHVHCLPSCWGNVDFRKNFSSSASVETGLLTFMYVNFSFSDSCVQVSASFDALMDIMGGKINIHVLMALAAFASVFMGNALEGGMLLAMFNLSHIAEEYFTSRSKIDVNELKENHPEFALLLDVKNGELPSFSASTYTEVPVSDLEAGSYLLVKAGEVRLRQSLSSHFL